MLFDSVLILVSLTLIVISADKFIDGAANVALHLKISPVLVGVIIVGFGTSAPEMIVSAIAAINDTPGIALGNAYGSNIVNISLVLGITLILYSIKPNIIITKQEVPALILFLVISFILFYDKVISRIDGLILLSILIAYLARTVYIRLKAKNDITEAKPFIGLLKSWVFLLLGLATLLLSSKMLVSSASNIAKTFGVSDLIIGLTIVAIGTSLPELAATAIAAKKKEYDIALGNIIGSGVFNILGVVGIATTIKPLTLKGIPSFLSRDFPFTFILISILAIFLVLSIKTKKNLGKTHGFLFIGLFSFYSFLLFQEAIK